MDYSWDKSCSQRAQSVKTGRVLRERMGIMFSHDDILTPLALTVIIDHKVRDPELAAFRMQATGLIELFELEAMSDEALAEWFKMHEGKLKESLAGRRKNTVVLRALTRFTEDMHVENLYDAMLAVSISDQEYHEEESELIKSAASIWGFSRPPFKVIKRN